VRDVFWVIPNHLGGRPGPNLYPWNERDLHDAGIRTILSVNDGEWVNVEALESLGIAYRCYPLSDTAPPRPGDIEHCQRVLPLAFEFVEAQLSQGRTTIVHCRSGKDRTGLFLSYYLCRAKKLSPLAAIAEIRKIRPIALSAEGWDEFAVQVLSSQP